MNPEKMPEAAGDTDELESDIEKARKAVIAETMADIPEDEGETKDEAPVTPIGPASPEVEKAKRLVAKEMESGTSTMDIDDSV